MANLRVIPVILLKNGRVVQSKSFSRHQVLGNASLIVSRFSNWYADELIYLDISRQKHYDLRRDDLNFENRASLLEILEDCSRKCFMPMTVGGGITTINDVEDRLKSGADKVAINSEAFRNPDFIEECAKIFGSQCIVISIDAKKVAPNAWEVFIAHGKEPTGKSPNEWAKRMQEMGAGEIIINSIDRDGQGKGFDVDLVRSVVESVEIPVIGLGGAGEWAHFAECFDQASPSAVAASNIFQYTENSVYNANKYLYENSYRVRQPSIRTIMSAGDN